MLTIADIDRACSLIADHVRQTPVIAVEGVVAASGGNHGPAVAHVARQLGIPAQIFVPEAAFAVKVVRIRALGA